MSHTTPFWKYYPWFFKAIIPLPLNSHFFGETVGEKNHFYSPSYSYTFLFKHGLYRFVLFWAWRGSSAIIHTNCSSKRFRLVTDVHIVIQTVYNYSSCWSDAFFWSLWRKSKTNKGHTWCKKYTCKQKTHMFKIIFT